MIKHENGPCKVTNGNLYSFTGDPIEHPAVILDIPKTSDSEEVITLLKYGSEEKILPHYENMRDRYVFAGLKEFAENITMISFNTITGFTDYDHMTQAKFSIDEICTLINWLHNVIPANIFLNLINSDENNIHAELSKLAEYGF